MLDVHDVTHQNLGLEPGFKVPVNDSQGGTQERDKKGA